MPPRLLPILLAAFLPSCHEKPAPPPPSIRLQVTASGTFSGNGILTSSATEMGDWLTREIETRRVDPDVRLDFNCRTPVWRMLNALAEIAFAGASTRSLSPYAVAIGFGVEGGNGPDFLLHYFEDVETSCTGEWFSGADEWGSWVVTEKYPGPRFEFSLIVNSGTISSDGMEITPDDLKELFKSRNMHGPVLVIINTDLETTVADLVPLMTMCRTYGALINITTDGQLKETSRNDHYRLMAGHHQPGLRLPLGSWTSLTLSIAAPWSPISYPRFPAQFPDAALARDGTRPPHRRQKPPPGSITPAPSPSAAAPP